MTTLSIPIEMRHSVSLLVHKTHLHYSQMGEGPLDEMSVVEMSGDEMSVD